VPDPLTPSPAVPPPVRVFHCDDSEPFRLLVHQMLLEFGGTEMVGEAETLKEAVALLPAAAPDVVLVDLFEHDRPEQLLPLLREAAPAARIVLYTGMPADRVPPGADGHIHKSVPFSALHRAILDATDPA
jgi:two-component system, NarL family, response regulator DevR